MTRPRRLRGVLTIVFGSLAIAYVAIALLARLVYPRILFPAPHAGVLPAGVSPAALVSLPQPGSGPTYVLDFPAPSESAWTVVLFHGNGETIFDEVDTADVLRAHGYGVMLVEYRGYGLSYGSPPTEEALYADGEAALARLAARGVGPDHVVLWGRSLGTSVAAEMARRGRGSKLILLAPFTSIVDMGRHVAPFLPVSLIMTHRLDTLSKANAIHVPTLVVHGDADEVVPFAMGEQVARAIPGARFVAIRGGHHNDIFQPPFGPAVLGPILEQLGSPPP